MNQVFGHSITLILVLLLCSCTEPPADNPSSAETISYTVLSEEVDESPGKTQLKMDILVPEGASEDELRALLNSLYQQASSRTGFQYHTHPTVIAVYAYPSREHAESGMGQWTAMLTKTPQNQQPKIQIHSSVSQEAVAEESRFGYSLDERKSIYKRIVGAEDRGQKEAELRYPNPNDLQRQFDYADELIDKYKNELAAELGLTLEQLKEIGREGVLSNWAMPQMSQ